MIMRKTSLILLGAAAGVAVTLIATQPRILLDGARAQAAAADTYRQLSLFGDVFERVRADYVEKPDDSKLIESAINGMLAGLDPHSSYMDSKSFRDMQVQTRGEFGGLGIEVTMEDGLIKVVSPIDDTPAAKAGIMANDIITHLDERREGSPKPKSQIMCRFSNAGMARRWGSRVACVRKPAQQQTPAEELQLKIANTIIHFCRASLRECACRFSTFMV